MSLTYWRITTPYDWSVEDHWESQSRFRKMFMELCGDWKSLTWCNGHVCPANWIGYTPENPSPGYTIHSHTWQVDNEEHAMIFMMACGNKIEKKEVIGA